MSNSLSSLMERLTRKRDHYAEAIKSLEKIQGLADADEAAPKKRGRPPKKAKAAKPTKAAKKAAPAKKSRKPKNMDPSGSIMRVLAKVDGKGMDRNAIARKANLNRTTATRYLATLIKGGEIKKVSWGKYGKAE